MAKGQRSEETFPSEAATHPDGHLIIRLRRGDVDALGELYEKYKVSIFRTALAVTKDRVMAEDVLQESFLRLFTNADKIKTNVPVGPWLYRVAVNLCYTLLKRRQRYMRPFEGLLGRLVAPLNLLPEQQLERAEARETVQRAIENLPVTHRAVVVLFYLEGLSLKEIANVLEIPEGTVKSRLHYARKSLKGVLNERRPVSEMVYEFT